ncbi:YraN family protein [Candidatus Dependentiae bacterium]|jgi:putative endonuclease|nr:YraN family protein [Candidatus Dependentiae bacterium]
MTTPRNHTQTLGQQGEQAVTQWLLARHFTILAQNYRTKAGEVDVIARKGELIVFVEVKTRSTAYFATSTVVTYGKQKKIGRAAQHFVLKNRFFDHVLRFDVATLVRQTNGSFSIEYIENAFVPQ